MEMTKTTMAAEAPMSAAPKNALLASMNLAAPAHLGLSASYDTTGVRRGMQLIGSTAVIDSLVSPRTNGFTGGVPPRGVPR